MRKMELKGPSLAVAMEGKKKKKMVMMKKKKKMMMMTIM
jgi:hypothetical protein